jgi:putative ABC transport system permease protein
MRALNLKLWRDLLRLRGQVATIALVVGCGVAGFVGAFSTHASLEASRDRYYRDAAFADVFGAVRRAPLALRDRIAAIDGVAALRLETVYDTQLDLPGVMQPLTGRIVGLEPGRREAVNRLSLRSGRWPERGAAAEVLVNDRFATLRGLAPGSSIAALLNGRRETLRIVGTVASPEYVYATRGGGPDDEWFGVLWLDAERVASAFAMEGAFNRVALRLAPGASEARVIDALDRLLEPYGSTGAVGRDRQLSALIVDNELRQQQVLGTVLPGIFLAVAAFILNVVLARQVATQRPQIAALKALGYRNTEIAGHYMLLAVAIAAAGVVLGLVGSHWLGRGMVWMYTEVFRFDALAYRMVPGVAVGATLAVAAAAALGALAAIRAVVRLSPAQAMLPPAPPVYRRTLLERLAAATARASGRVRRLAPAALMVLRNLERRPLRAVLTVCGIAAAVALQVTGLFWNDTIARIVDVQFRQVQQGDLLLDFHEPVDVGVQRELLRLPGVLEAEVWRSEPVRITAGGQLIDTALNGYAEAPRLMRVVDAERGAQPLPADGLVLSGLLARQLGVAVGDRIGVEFRLWHRRQVELTVVGVVHTLFGRQAYMALDAMNRAAGDGSGASDAALRLDPQQRKAFFAAVKATPRIAAVFDKAGALESFQKTTARNIGYFTAVLTLFAVAMAVGITYNAARVALSERAWELASLRVMGMTRAEVSVLLLAELALELLLALPLGAALGWGLANGLMQAMQSDEIDFPVVIAPATYGLAALTVVATGVLSALAVRQRIDRLDLVAVLKTRE